jgi:hypothetical protein
VLCDRDGDGRDEVVAYDRGAGEIFVLRYDGELVEIGRDDSDDGGHRLRCDDLDGDGRGDVVAAAGYGTGSALRIYYGGDGTIDDPVLVAPSWLTILATGDLDDDGDVDLLGALDGDAELVLPMLKDGETFSEGEPAAAGACVHDIEIAQLDDDGLMDAVTADTGSDSITFLRGAGDGSFLTSQSISLADGPIGCHAGPEALAVADWDADGDQDVAVVHRSGGLFVIYAQDSGEWTRQLELEVPAVPLDLEAGDLDGDGRLDAVVASLESEPGAQGQLTHDHEGGVLSILLARPRALAP